MTDAAPVRLRSNSCAVDAAVLEDLPPGPDAFTQRPPRRACTGCFDSTERKTPNFLAAKTLRCSVRNSLIS
ncbi:hypothetical protein BJF82_11410 [Kytococcus sp. CUA-901]|nr:hypothetical protein BJF82_11410 [Kytococcus sp. CUA-901]